MKGGRVLAAIIAGVGISAAATAQSYKDYGMPVDTPEIRAWSALSGAARCAIDDVPASVRKVLATEPASKQESSAVKSMESVTKCFADDRGETDPILVYNALAEVSYLEKYRHGAPDVAKVTAKLPATFGVTRPGEQGTPKQEGAWTLAAVANCTVFAASSKVRDLIIVPRGVPEEQTRFDALKPTIAACMGHNQLQDLTPGVFRGYLAAALWRQAEAAER